MSKTMRNILIVTVSTVIVIAALCLYAYLPLDGLQYPAGKYSSGTEDELPVPPVTAEDKEGSDGVMPDLSAEDEYKLVYITLMVSRGDKATVRIQGKPDTKYSIEVHYASGISSANGLEDKVSDREGYAEWTWTVGSNAYPGVYEIYIKDNGEEVIHGYIQVTE